MGASEFRVYDGANLTPRYYLLDATPDRHLKLSYNPFGTNYTLIDCYLNASNQSVISFPLGISVSNTITAQNEIINGTLSIPSYSDVKASLDTLMSRTTNQSWTSNNTKFAIDYLTVGTSVAGVSTPIQLYGSQVNGIGVSRGGMMLTSAIAGGSSTNSVPMGFVNTIDELFDLGINCGNVALTRNTARQGVQFRFDSRDTEKAFQVQTVERVNGTVRNAINALHTGVCEIPIRLDLLSGANMTQTGTGIIDQSSSTGGTNLFKDTSISGVLSITGYSNVKTTLDSLVTTNTALTGITYDIGTDKTTIDNNLLIGNDKILTLGGTGGIQQTGTGMNILNNVNLGISGYISYDDGTTQKSKYIDDAFNETDIHGFVNSKTIRFATFNLGTATNASLVALGSGYHFITAVRLVKGITYTGIGIYTGTAGSFQVAMYGAGLTPPRMAFSNSFTTTANTMNYIPFAIPYPNGTTQIVYASIRTTSATQTVLFLPTNNFHNYGNNTVTNSTFNKRSQYYASTADYSTLGVIPTGLAQINQLQYVYLVLYS